MIQFDKRSMNFRNRDVNDSNRVGQLDQRLGDAGVADANNDHGYEVAGNAHITSAFTVTAL